jgi:transcriptional regulator with XRE-family HTH domain
MPEKVIHQGRAVKRIREILGKKQEELAVDLGITQQAISLLEAKEIIDPKILDDVARILHVPVDAIKNFTAYAENYKCSFNPIDKVIELYDQLLKEKDEKIALLERLLAVKK